MLRLTLHGSRRFLGLTVLGSRAACLSPGSRATAQVVNPFANIAGVSVDANGVLKTQIFPDANGQLSKQRREAARAALDPKLATPSKLRKVSLNRLEEAVK